VKRENHKVLTHTTSENKKAPCDFTARGFFVVLGSDPDQKSPSAGGGAHKEMRDQRVLVE